MFNHHDITRDACMLKGPLAHHGYDWWWHSFTAQDVETGEDKAFLLSSLSAIRTWQKMYLYSDNCRKTKKQESGLRTLW